MQRDRAQTRKLCTDSGEKKPIMADGGRETWYLAQIPLSNVRTVASVSMGAGKTALCRHMWQDQ